MSDSHSSQYLYGLSVDEVIEREESGRTNSVSKSPSREFSEILRANLLTPVNGIIGSLFVLIMIAAPGVDALFAGVVISNSVMGIAQELKAKRTLDQLALLNSPRATVIRAGQELEIPVEQVVSDDILKVVAGDQVVVDGIVLASASLSIDESLLTGESDLVMKDETDELLSGSYVSSGSGHYQATRIGSNSYAAGLAAEAKRFELAHSELRNGIDQILRWLGWIIPPAAMLLLWSLWGAEENWKAALRGTVAAAIAMVPDGLVLLTSLAMIVGVVRLAKKKALANELASIELLARVDVLCLDKTGTLTTGNIKMKALESIDGSPQVAALALAAISQSDPSPNPTLDAIGAVYNEPTNWSVVESVPFSSSRKWASTTFLDKGTWILGAPEMLLTSASGDTENMVKAHAKKGHRVLLLAHSSDSVVDEQLPQSITEVALLLLDDEIRHDARDTLCYLRDQGLQLRVISGDHPETVAAIARRVGIDDAAVGVDARSLPDNLEELAEELENNLIFGRVTPHQKQAMVAALQSRGHIVAMTGDGVNDVLALKDADMGIAMGSGSPASRSVAQLVLLDDSFATLPSVLAEGRRVINNIERVANLFVVKATYAVLLTLAIGAMNIEFPFLPRHLTLVGTISIGLPGFFLALYPDSERAKPGFLGRVLRFAIPAGTVITITTLFAYLVMRADNNVALDQSRTAATVVLVGVGLIVLVQLAMPLNRSKLLLIGGMAATLLMILNSDATTTYFALNMPPTDTWWILSATVTVGAVILLIGPLIIPGWYDFQRDHKEPNKHAPKI